MHNDYLCISRQSIFGLRNAEVESAKPNQNFTGENNANSIDSYNRDFGNYHFSPQVLGPSFSVATTNKEKKIVIGLFSPLRTQSTALDMHN